MKKNRLTWLLCVLTLLVAVCLQGCGGPKSQEELLANMQEFATADGSAAIYLDKDWKIEDMGIEYFMCAANESGTRIAILMQFQKSGVNQMASSLDEVKDLIKTSYGYSASGESQEAPQVPGMTNVQAERGTAQVEGTSAEIYLVYGETDYAYYAILYGANSMNDNEIAYAKASCSKFSENAPEEEDATTVELTDTVRWFNASYAVLTELNGWDYNRFAGLPANDESKVLEQESLKEWWDVTDRATADETLEWALTEGHRAGFVENMSYLEENGMSDVAEADRVGFVHECFVVTDDQAAQMAEQYKMYEEFGASALDGWDYCRAMNLVSFYYLAGYYTEQEALDKSLEIAQMIQPLFGSWDELVDSYMRGYEYWAEESADERRAVYEDLKSREDNPYAVDFNTSLEKTW